MPDKINASQLTKVNLDRSTDLCVFSCSNDDKNGVDEFIHKEACKYQEEQMGVTTLFYLNESLVGFVTLSMSCIDAEQAPDAVKLGWIGRKKPPSLLVGQIGTDNNYRRQGVCRIMLDYAYKLAFSIGGSVGCRYIFLECHPNNVPIYEACGFEATKKKKSGDVFMVRRVIPTSLME